ncbi:MAG: hypothetical protein K0S08_1865 [Gammaproteobacteria bacterium]|jgi:hypothetical protein|nr:hypothetical protein [Gammaproteobacteria bacterium]
MAPPLSPLSKEEKIKILTQLTTTSNDEALSQALSKAACENLRFPKDMEAQLSSLKDAYCQHHKNPLAAAGIKQAIDAVIKETILPLFKTQCEKQEMPDEWPGELLVSLSKALNLTMKPPKLVQVAINEGKIYWRVRKGEKVLYDRQKTKGLPSFDFTDENSLEMTWEQFRQFKDTGKRRGTVKITLERFTNFFDVAKQDQAMAVWHELKTKGIIDTKDRLSDVWRFLSDATVTLDALTDPQLVMTKPTLKNILQKLRGTSSKPKPMTQQAFLQECLAQFPHISITRHQAIWNTLTKAPTKKPNEYKVSLVFKEEDVLSPVHLSYEDIAKAIFEITHNKETTENIDEIKAAIFRPEHSVKAWSSTGTVKNDLSKSNCTQLWEVSVYGDLSHHRNSEQEQVLYGHILNYDHIPSACLLTDFTAKQLEPLKAEIKALKAALKAQEEKIKSYETQKRVTRSHLETLEKEMQTLSNAIAAKNIELQEAKARYGDDKTWFTLAIPEKLHRQGETFLKALSAQKTEVKPFTSELEAYLGILAKRPEDFGFEDQKCLFLFLAALRHLYRCQVKTPVDSFRIGHAPQAFFQHHKLSEKLDQIFVGEAKKILPKIS